MEKSYSVIIVGTGFGSSFFLHEYLRHASADDTVLVLDRGEKIPYDWKYKNRENSDFDINSAYNNLTPQKVWVQSIGFGGGGCWNGNANRMHPSDFRTKTLHGVGEDWPFTYEEFEPFLADAEAIMGIAGEGNGSYPRSAPYPMRAHKFNAFDLLLKEKYGDEYSHMPSARASEAKHGRPACCNNGVCTVCPIGAKFQIDLHMTSIYDDPRVTLKTGCNVQALSIINKVATGVHCVENGKETHYRGDFFAVGAHAIFTPFILLNSGIEQEALGRYLSEQIDVNVWVNLDNVENYDGGQRVTGLGSMFVNEDNRDTAAGCIIYNYNVPRLRAEFGKWRHSARLKFVMEDLPSADKRVTVGENGKPDVYYPGYSEYLQKGLDTVPGRVERLLDGLPIEDYYIAPKNPNRLGTTAHIQGTTRMGNDPKNSVVDANLINHSVRNIAVLGSGAFPTCAATNPTLILSALSIKSARSLFA